MDRPHESTHGGTWRHGSYDTLGVLLERDPLRVASEVAQAPVSDLPGRNTNTIVTMLAPHWRHPDVVGQVAAAARQHACDMAEKLKMPQPPHLKPPRVVPPDVLWPMSMAYAIHDHRTISDVANTMATAPLALCLKAYTEHTHAPMDETFPGWEHDMALLMASRLRTTDPVAYAGLVCDSMDKGLLWPAIPPGPVADVVLRQSWSHHRLLHPHAMAMASHLMDDHERSCAQLGVHAHMEHFAPTAIAAVEHGWADQVLVHRVMDGPLRTATQSYALQSTLDGTHSPLLQRILSLS